MIDRSVRVGLMVAAACSGAAPPRAPAAEEGRAERVRIGDLEAYALLDGHLVVPNDGALFGAGRPPAETAEVLAAAGLARDEIHLDIQCLLVKDGERVMLFDAGAGDLVPGAGLLPRSLALAHVAPGAVTDVFISHAHGDHVGGLVTPAGERAFPAATVHLSAPEWASLQANTDDDSRRVVAAIAPAVAAFEPGAQVLPDVTAVATPGHTPGHSSFAIGAGADAVLYLGDVAHHAVLSVQRPAWSVGVDADPPAANAVREATLATLAARGTRVFVGHFPFAGIGQVIADGDHFAWRPER